MADFSEIVTSISSLGTVISSIFTSGDKVEVAKYQAEIAKSNATAEEKKYALKLAQDRLDKLKTDEDKAQKRKNIVTYSLVGLGVVIILGVTYYFLRPKSPIPIAPVANIVKVNPIEPVSVPKPLQLI